MSTLNRICLYLDEQGTPGMSQPFLTGGVLIHGKSSEVGLAWESFQVERGYNRKKGKKYTSREFQELASFLIGQPIIPIGIHSHLTSNDIEDLKSHARRYRKSQDPRKTAPSIAPASWIWKHHLSLAVNYSIATATEWVGPIGAAELHVDKFSDNPKMQAHFKALLMRTLSARQAQDRLATLPIPAIVKAVVLERIGSSSWIVNLNAKGSLANLADVMCSMYAAFRESIDGDAWGAIRIKFKTTATPGWPPCMGSDVTNSVRQWIAKVGKSLDLLES